MTLNRNIPVDQADTKMFVKDWFGGRKNKRDKSWLGHTKAAGELDYLLVEGATKEELEAVRESISVHTSHLKTEHGINVINVSGKYILQDTLLYLYEHHEKLRALGLSANDLEQVRPKFTLRKNVGKSQYKDGVRINKEFHPIFNPPGDIDYVSRGEARAINISFNGKYFDANYRYEGTLASDNDLQRIGFSKAIIDEFEVVFPSHEGYFSIRLGEDINHFIFEVIESASKGTWTERECYFAVWCYDQMDQDNSVVKTELYNQVASIIGRSNKSVEWKVQNASACDPRPRSEKPISEAPNAQKLLKDVFDWYWADKEKARSKYSDYYQEATFEKPSSKDTFRQPEHVIIEEGAPGYQQSKTRKRSLRLLTAAREHYAAQEPDGKLRCKACGFSKPESVSREIVQMHHTEPIADSGDGKQMILSEAVKLVLPLCPTCHQLAHCGKPPLLLNEIKSLLKQPIS